MKKLDLNLQDNGVVITLELNEVELKLIDEGLIKVFNSNTKLLKENNPFSTNKNEKAQLKNENEIIENLRSRIIEKLRNEWGW